MKNVPILNLNSFLTTLGNSPDYGPLLAKARQLEHIQKHLQSAIPSQLRERCAIGQHTSDGHLVIYADNGTVATRLRHLVPSIQQKMNKAGIKVENIRLLIQPQIYSPESGNTREISRSLSFTAVEHLTRLSNSLSSGSLLKNSLRMLLTNSRHE